MKNSPIARRTLLARGGLGLSAGLMVGVVQPADARSDLNHGIWSEGRVAKKGDVKLAMYRKWLGEKGGWPDKPLPVLFLVHGSSLSSMSSYDLDVPRQRILDDERVRPGGL